VGAEVERGYLVLLGVAHGQDDDRHLRPFANPSADLQAVDHRQSQVEQDHIGPPARRLIQRGLAIRGHSDLVAVRAERGLQQPPDLRLVVDDQDARAHKAPPACAWSRGGRAAALKLALSALASGSVNIKRAPPSGAFSAQIRPPCASTMPLQIASPSPTPLPGRSGWTGRTNFSKIRARIPSGMPGPS